MNLTGIIVVFGAIAVLGIIAIILGLIDKSRSGGEWFSLILKRIGIILAYILLIDIQLLVLLMAIMIVWGVAYYPLSWGQENLSVFWNYTLITFSFIYFLLWLWLTGTKNFYNQFSYAYSDKGKATVDESTSESKPSLIDSILRKGMRFLLPLMVIIGLVMLSITCFSALTSALHINGSVRFDPVMEDNGIGKISDFYLWHFFDLIPQIKVNETLNWEAPLKYTHGGIAALLLLFKSLMAYIVIARFYTWNKWRRGIQTT